MLKRSRSLLNVCLSLVTCILVVGLSALPLWSQDMGQPDQMQWPMRTEQPSESVVAGKMGKPAMSKFRVTLSGDTVVPKAVVGAAMGMAEATLMGDRLMVQGSFRGLSSPLRDYATDPATPPNPKVTSAVHIHRGAATENGPFQGALMVMPNNMGMGGTFSGEYTLSSEQQQALQANQLYIDLHTQQNRMGELRGYFRPAA